jgi:mono/diheme cytochrome c family protein
MTEPTRSGNDPRGLRHPFWQAVAVFVGAWAVFKIGIEFIPPLFGVASARVPNSVVLQYVLTALVGVLLYVSADEERWRQFKAPIHRLLVEPGRRAGRIVLLVIVPVLVGLVAYRQVSATVRPPPSLRAVHPAPPSEITFQGRSLRLEGLENPLRHEGDMAEHLAVGSTVYVQNCMPCHGDRMDGQGHFAHAFNPLPADFTSNGTIAQLTESYVFWRVAKGGPGLPKEGMPWNSAMPAWDDLLTEDEIWSVILYLYDQTGWSPRTWEEEDGEGDGH